MSPAERSGSALTSARDCSPFVDTLAAQMTSASDAACLTSSTVMSLRNAMSGTVAIVPAATVSSIVSPLPKTRPATIMPVAADKAVARRQEGEDHFIGVHGWLARGLESEEQRQG